MRNPIHIIHENRRLPEIEHDGNLFAMSPSSGEYQIAIDIEPHSRGLLVHRTGLRYEVVVSVDGLSVMDGHPASTSGRGYIVKAGQELVIPGWRMNASGAAKFIFTAAGGSYAELMSQGSRNMGVIGAAVFVEEVPIKELHDAHTALEHTADPCRTKMSMSVEKSVKRGSLGDISATVGTGFGEATRFETRQVDFVRGGQVGVFTLYYRTREWLRASGIPVPGEHGIGGSSAFPADTGCTPPPGWRPRS
jgi:hypothetical protein